MKPSHNMILVELAQPDGFPIVREVSQPHFLRLAVVDAYRGGRILPGGVFEAVEDTNANNPGAWAFFSIESAAVWAATYQGLDAEHIRFLIREHQEAELDEAV
jgi:hypothetical protein